MSNPSMPHGTVHIVDDDDALRAALIRLCRSAGLEATGHADASSLLAAIEPGRPSCILLDMRLAGRDGLEVQDMVRAAGCTVPIIFLTGHGTIPMTVRAMRGGAVEFLTKPVDGEELLAAIGRALRGEADRLAAGRGQDELVGRLVSLSPREREVFGLVIGGLQNKQVAAELGISEITAKVHKRRVMDKMAARSLADLVGMAGRLGIAASRRR
ncbi:response regulator transcription factor [Muricoccus nepalensis]|nr:response regulator [Roseomonas nepalensis]